MRTILRALDSVGQGNGHMAAERYASALAVLSSVASLSRFGCLLVALCLRTLP
jgi:hypothetical protein